MKRFLTLTLLLFSVFYSNATHIVGGELNYRCLGNNNYEISLTVFRDCFNGVPPFDDPAYIGVFDSSNNLIIHDSIDFTTDVFIDAVLFDSCLVIPPNVCVHRSTYVDTLNLPFKPGGYQIAYQRCCRNSTIVNIESPTITGATFYAFISEGALNQCNSNPVFNEWPPIYICANTPINFDHSATDLDGDSLVYELCTPFDGASINVSQPNPPLSPPYDTINWKNGFGLNNMLGGTSNPLTIDPQTGLLTGLPNAVGQFVVGVCVKEYRNGVLIGSTRRDFQYNIGICSQEFIANFSAPDVKCDGLTVQIANQSSAGAYLWDFGVLNATDDTSTAANPSFTYPDTGVYDIRLIVGVGAPCADTQVHTIRVLEESILWDINLEYDGCADSVIVLNFQDVSTDATSTINDWRWIFSTGDTAASQSGTITLSGDTANQYQVWLINTNAIGCQAFGTEIIQSIPIKYELSSGEQICRGATVPIEFTDLNDIPLIHQWLEDFEGDSTDNIVFVDPIDSTYYPIYITNGIGCEKIDSVLVNASANQPPLEIFAEDDSVYIGESVQLSATLDLGYQYFWQPDPTLSDTAIFNPVVTPIVPTTYFLTITDGDGCVNTDSISIFLENFICDEPYIFIPNAFTPNNDGKNDILYVRASTVIDVQFQLYNRWGELIFETNDQNVGWDGTLKGVELPPDVYGYFLMATCPNGEEYKKQGNITLLR